MARTRKEIEEQYRVVDGVIRSPGKFEGEPVWAPHYWDLALEGCADDEEAGDDEPLVSYFFPDASDVQTWPELLGIRSIHIWESDQGFVYTDTFKVKP